jgi:bacillithiol biosynthesis cysteine-adding enzyme BshC
VNPGRVPFSRYPGLPPLFLDFLQGAPAIYPDPPTADACAARAKELSGVRARVPAGAWRYRSPEAAAAAAALAEGRMAAAIAGHQVGIFTGPLYTLTKAFDAQRVARDVTRRGAPAAPVFWALTDDHDLEEVGKTAWPGPDGAEVSAVDGADRSNRAPVGRLPVPERAREVLEVFRFLAKAPDAGDVIDQFARRYVPGRTYGEAFIETLLDLVEPAPLLVLDPYQEALREATAEFFAIAVEKRDEIQEVLKEAAGRLERRNRPAPVPYREGVFPFFLIADGERRRVTDPEAALSEVRAGKAFPSADVLTRPVLKSFLLPVAASILGPAEIAYHAQSLPLFALFGVRPPVLLPRSHLVLLGPGERRAVEALGIPAEDILGEPAGDAGTPIPQADEIQKLAESLRRGLTELGPGLKDLDPSLSAALETTLQKATFPLGQFQERIRKAAERRDTTTLARRQRLETMLRPKGTTAERLYPPLVPLLAYGRETLAEIRDAATGSLEGASIVSLGGPRAEKGEQDAG